MTEAVKKRKTAVEEIYRSEIGLREAKERANCAGKILSSAKLQLEYNTYTKSDAKIPFLDV